MNKLKRLVFYLILMLVTDAKATCYKEIKSRLPTHGTVIFGEIHGTVELPAFFLDCVREFHKRNDLVQIFLETPFDLNDNLKKYIKGEILPMQFISEAHWKKKDGRASVAMWNLIDEIKNSELRNISTFGLDISKYSEDRDSEIRNNFMKNYSPNSYNFVLVGNLHAQLVTYRRGSKIITPFASLLRAEVFDMVSLRAAYSAGSAWACTPDCGLKDIEGNLENFEKLPSNNVYWNSTEEKYSGVFKVNSISASPPARKFEEK